MIAAGQRGGALHAPERERDRSWTERESVAESCNGLAARGLPISTSARLRGATNHEADGSSMASRGWSFLMSSKALSLVLRVLLASSIAFALQSCAAKDEGPSPQGDSSGAGALPGGSGNADGGNASPAAPGGTGGLQPGPGGGTAGSAGPSAPGAAGMDGVSGIEPIAIDQCGANNPAGLSAAQVSTLRAGGSAGSMRLLYPYDGTVFPRGLAAPVMMWDAGGSDAAYLHLKAGRFEFHGCLRPNAAGQLTIPQDVWDAAGRQTGGRSDPLTVELTTLNGQSANGPIKASWVIAQATIKGSIYYNSYNSQLSTQGGGMAALGGGAFGGLGGGGFGGGNNGSILRIRPGRNAEAFARSGSCTGCHSVSANGQRMIMMDLGAAAGGVFGGLGGLLGGGGGLEDGQTYALTPDTMPNPAPARAAAAASFTGLTPDGKLYVSSSSSLGIGPRGAGGQSLLYETDSGRVVPDSGIPASAMMPTFSADGTLLVFSDGAQGGKALVLMDFDAKSGKATKARTIATHASLLGWPFILPDNRGVIFAVTDQSDFSGAGIGVSGPAQKGAPSDLAMVDLSTGKLIWLAKTIGFQTPADVDTGKTYLPFGAQDLHQHYFPTVSPVSAGGYFWIFFDTVRNYGKLGLHRQLWGAAIAVASVTELSTGNYDADPSFPAFYLPGQELPVANHRAFTALDPCRADGADCESGVDCCSGFCTHGKCGRPMERCSQTGEACKTKSDCCKSADQCVGGFCDIILF